MTKPFLFMEVRIEFTFQARLSSGVKGCTLAIHAT